MCNWDSGSRRLTIFKELSENRKTPAETGQMIVDALTFEDFKLKEYGKDREGQWIDDIPDGSDHSIDAVRYAMMEDVFRG